MNQKGCEQFSSGDKPHIVTCSVRLSNADNEIRVAKNTWVVRNACVKAAAAWRRDSPLCRYLPQEATKHIR